MTLLETVLVAMAVVTAADELTKFGKRLVLVALVAIFVVGKYVV